MSHQSLMRDLTRSGILVSQQIVEAFQAVKREHFVVPEYLHEAYEDAPLPIGAGQTISQPRTVALMLELLDPQSDQKILDVGAGSGWTTALLGHIVGERGRVYGVEIIPELVTYGKANLAKMKMPQASIQTSGMELGLPQHAPYDRILVSASAEKFPEELFSQLANGGVMVFVLHDSVIRLQKLQGFVFVPLTR
jgi:protein-L-isoaspartate(D-aspartate) O-methyltransferase